MKNRTLSLSILSTFILLVMLAVTGTAEEAAPAKQETAENTEKIAVPESLAVTEEDSKKEAENVEAAADTAATDAGAEQAAEQAASETEEPAVEAEQPAAPAASEKEEKKAESAETSGSNIYCSKAHEISSQRKAKSWVDSILTDEAITKTFDSLFALETDERVVKKFQTKQPVYYGTAFKTIDAPFKDVTDKIRICKNYRQLFKYIRDFQIISANSDQPECLTAYSEIGALFFKAWFIVNLDSISTDDKGVWTLSFSKNHFPPLNAVWEKKGKPWFTYMAREITIRFYVKEIDEKKTRVGYVLAVDSKSKVPGWIFRMVGKRVFPRFMKDLEKSLKPDL